MDARDPLSHGAIARGHPSKMRPEIFLPLNSNMAGPKKFFRVKKFYFLASLNEGNLAAFRTVKAYESIPRV